MTQPAPSPDEGPEKLAAIIGAVQIYLAEERIPVGRARPTGMTAWKTAVWESSLGRWSRRSWRRYG